MDSSATFPGKSAVQSFPVAVGKPVIYADIRDITSSFLVLFLYSGEFVFLKALQTLA